MGLGYFVCPGPEEGKPGAPDRRVVLPPGRSLADLDGQEVAALWEGAAPLTDSERRFPDDGGELWLAQATGPVWSDSGANDAIGFRLVCLTRDCAPVEIRSRRLSEMEDGDLSALVALPTS